MIFFLWFFNFPSLRYAGYIIVFLMIIFPYSVFVSNKIDFSKKNNIKTFNHFSDFLLCFLTKNISRIESELNLSDNVHHNFKTFLSFGLMIKIIKRFQ